MVTDWLADAPELNQQCPYVEVQFKNTRKGYYLNKDNLDLHPGDWVAVEGNPGHDIGEVTLTGYLVHLQMKKSGYHFDDPEATKKVFRIARDTDMQRYEEAKAKEHETMIRSRQIAQDLGLEMKIGDVEYQGDGQKAIFYYIADGRVDFRQLIKVLAEAFKVRIEMKQIGARQEAGRIGGIGPCGRELCCAKWLTKFQSVGTAAARFQDLSLNPQKLAGQCAKLKCCMNFEVDCYMECSKKLPPKDVVLQTADCDYYYFKADILAQTITYSTSKDGPFNLQTISKKRAFEIIEMNKHGQKPEKLLLEKGEVEEKPHFTDGVGDEDLNRFDRRKKKNKNHSKAKKAAPATPAAPNPAPAKQPKGGNDKPNGNNDKPNGGNGKGGGNAKVNNPSDNAKGGNPGNNKGGNSGGNTKNNKSSDNA